MIQAATSWACTPEMQGPEFLGTNGRNHCEQQQPLDLSYQIASLASEKKYLTKVNYYETIIVLKKIELKLEYSVICFEYNHAIMWKPKTIIQSLYIHEPELAQQPYKGAKHPQQQSRTPQLLLLMTKMHPALVIQQENGCASNPHPIGIYSSRTLKKWNGAFACNSQCTQLREECMP